LSIESVVKLNQAKGELFGKLGLLKGLSKEEIKNTVFELSNGVTVKFETLESKVYPLFIVDGEQYESAMIKGTLIWRKRVVKDKFDTAC